MAEIHLAAANRLFKQTEPAHISGNFISVSRVSYVDRSFFSLSLIQILLIALF